MILNTASSLRVGTARTAKVMHGGFKIWTDHKNNPPATRTHQWWGEFLADGNLTNASVGKGDSAFSFVDGGPEVSDGDIIHTAEVGSKYSYTQWQPGHQNSAILCQFIQPTLPNAVEFVNAQATGGDSSFRVYLLANGQVQVSDMSNASVWTSSGTPLTAGDRYTLSVQRAADGNVKIAVRTADGDAEGREGTGIAVGTRDVDIYNVGIMWSDGAVSLRIIGLGLDTAPSNKRIVRSSPSVAAYELVWLDDGGLPDLVGDCGVEVKILVNEAGQGMVELGERAKQDNGGVAVKFHRTLEADGVNRWRAPLPLGWYGIIGFCDGPALIEVVAEGGKRAYEFESHHADYTGATGYMRAAGDSIGYPFDDTTGAHLPDIAEYTTMPPGTHAVYKADTDESKFETYPVPGAPANPPAYDNAKLQAMFPFIDGSLAGSFEAKFLEDDLASNTHTLDEDAMSRKDAHTKPTQPHIYRYQAKPEKLDRGTIVFAMSDDTPPTMTYH